MHIVEHESWDKFDININHFNLSNPQSQCLIIGILLEIEITFKVKDAQTRFKQFTLGK